MQKLLIASLFFIIIASSIPSCGASQEKMYRGTAYVTANYGGGTTESYTKDVEVILSPPTKCESLVESNPFGLTISTAGSNTAMEGEFFIESCLSYSNPTMFEGCVLLQYWTFALNGNQIGGELTNNHLDEAAALNLFYGWDQFYSSLAGEGTGWPFPMAQDTGISGQIDDQTAELNIEGNTEDQSVHFVIEIDARRV